jgi:hypothetical protein
VKLQSKPINRVGRLNPTESEDIMTQNDVAGLLQTYAEKCRKAYNTQRLKEIIRDLKSELNYKEINKMKVIK